MKLEPGLNEVHCPEFSKGPECQVEEVGGIAAKEGHEQKLEVVVVSRLELEKSEVSQSQLRGNLHENMTNM